MTDPTFGLLEKAVLKAIILNSLGWCTLMLFKSQGIALHKIYSNRLATTFYLGT